MTTFFLLQQRTLGINSWGGLFRIVGLFYNYFHQSDRYTNKEQTCKHRTDGGTELVLVLHYNVRRGECCIGPLPVPLLDDGVVLPSLLGGVAVLLRH